MTTTRNSKKKTFEKKYKILIHKAYFDKGWAFSSYIKYLIALFGLSSLDVKSTIYLGLGYAIFCYILGYLMYKYQFVEAEAEINNRFNLFVKEMRRSIR